MRLLRTLVPFSLIAAALVFAWLVKTARAPGPLQADKLVLIAPGTGTAEIGEQLRVEGVVSSVPAYLVSVVLQGAHGRMKAGEYLFSRHIPATQAIRKMAEGKVYVRKVTIPEGVSVFDAAALVRAADGLKDDVMTLPPEGYILPETYHYTRGETRQAVMNRMKASMDKVLRELWTARAPDFPLETPDQALTLASIVEKETGIPSERPQIASVFFNRLKMGMKLQSDPTVIYALTKGERALGRPLYSGDLEKTDSPYNTYRHTGLPPGPIANPGMDALRAVFAPATTDALYFVADGTGGHVFAKTLAEHNHNVSKWRALLNQNNVKK